VRLLTRRAWVLPGVLIAVALVAVVVVVALFPDHAKPKVFFGLDVPDGSGSAVSGATASSACAPTVQSAFVKLDSTSFTLAKLRDIAALGTPFITLEPWSLITPDDQANQPQYSLARIASGLYDADLRRIASVIAGFESPVYLRFAHEMNGNWYPWGSNVNGNQPEDYVRAWKHVYDVFKTADARNAMWVWSPDAQPGGKAVALQPLYPGDAYVAFVGLTAYGHTKTEPTATDTVEPALQQIEQLSNRPVILSEIGADGPGKAAWIQSLGQLLRANRRIRGFVWFNTTAQTTGATGDYIFNDNSADVSSFRAMLAQAHVRCGPLR
jgi:Glycosyl hydrolase family 26